MPIEVSTRMAQVMILDHFHKMLKLSAFLQHHSGQRNQTNKQTNKHIVLVFQVELPFKHCQVTLLLTSKEKLPKCQQIPLNFAGGKNTSPSISGL